MIFNTNIGNYITNNINSNYIENNLSIEQSIIDNAIFPIKINNSRNIKKSNEDNIIKDIMNVSNIDTTNILYDPIIYIYNSHDTEKYKLNYISDYSIVPDVRVASYILKDYLNDLNINSYVEGNRPSEYVKKNKLSYSHSYEGSRKYLLDAKEKNNFIIFIDIHRDSSKYNKTIYEKDGIKYAKVLFVLGKKNKSYKENEKFIKYLNGSLTKKYDGISRGILNRDDSVFNQDISNNAILLELGGVDNTIEEINNTLKVFSLVLKEYIDDEGLNGGK